MFSFNRHNSFSPETKELLAKAHEIAVDLGDITISTIHFFIANCNMEYNPKEYLFSSEEEFNKFYELQRRGKPKTLDYDKPLPLTEEAGKTIRFSLQMKRGIKSKQVQPVHLMLAATQLYDSQFYALCKDKHDAYQELFEFYKSKGFLIETVNEDIVKKIKNFFFGRSKSKV